MTINISDDFDLKKIADSGQCFRWNAMEDGSYRIVSQGKVLHIKCTGETKEGKSFEYDCPEEVFDTYWRHYLDLDTNYASIRTRVEENDPYLLEAADAGTGIRILNQEPWETLISFIISQRKSIPAIMTSIERISKRFGDLLLTEPDGEEVYAFPTPVQLVNADVTLLGECGLGYRTDYIRRAADQFLDSGDKLLNDYAKMSDPELTEALMKLQGVGIKVASCTMLFGFHRLDLFPKDVWIIRMLEDKYPGGFNFEKYAPYNGLMQQYLFYHYRNNNK